MAEARQRAEWLRVGVLGSWVINRNGWTREPVNPLDLIPAPFRPPAAPVRVLSAEERAEESRRGWHVLDRFFGRP